MESIGSKTLSLMTEAILNYIQNLSIGSPPELKEQLDDCLQKLKDLNAITHEQKAELKRAA